MEDYVVDFDELLEMMGQAIEEQREELEMAAFIASSPYGYHYCPACS